MDTPRLLVIDGLALAYRGHFALMNNPRVTGDGRNTSAVFVFANVLLEAIQSEQPTHLAVVWDAPGPTFRHERYPAYKATRDAMPEDLAAGLPMIRRLCAALRVPVIERTGLEADDLAGALAARADAAGWWCGLLTPDKDYAQLVGGGVVQLKPRHKGGGWDTLDAKAVCSTWQVREAVQVAEILALMGDSSDNVPGVPGVGQKTATKLLAEHGTLAALLDAAAAGAVKGKVGEKLAEFRAQAELSLDLVRICREPDAAPELAGLLRAEPDTEALQALCQDLELATLAKRLLGVAAAAAVKAPSGALRGVEEREHHYRIVATAAARAALVEELRSHELIAFDLETTGLDARRCEAVGLALCWAPGEAAYVPLSAENWRAELAEFASLFADPQRTWAGHHLKFDVQVLASAAVPIAGALHDSLIAASLVLQESRARSLDDLAAELLAWRTIPIENLLGPKGPEQRGMRTVPLDAIATYAAEDADVAFQLHAELAPRVIREGGERVWTAIEGPLIPVLAGMEREGIRLDSQSLAVLGDELRAKANAAAARVYELAGGEFNLNSPKQLSELLFERLGLNPGRKTATGQRSTAEAVLQRLAPRHEICARILEYRGAAKLVSTYVETLPLAVDPDTGRIHTHYDSHVTATGRLVSHNPNLQNVPVRGEDGRDIRRAFVARAPGWLLMAADYSQIELRLAAALSGDEAMIAAFASGTDFHTATAARLAGCAPDLVDGELRRRAKTVNFGILYGISAFGLSERLGIPRGEASDLIEAYFTAFPRLRAWLDAVVERAREQGWAETICGRRRHLRDILSRNAVTRQAAERIAINLPIQGSAADLIKLAMIAVSDGIRRRGLQSRLILQVHDELVLDCHPDERDELEALVRSSMVGALELPVPIEVDIGLAANWLDAH